jgi:hypothetical protein
MHFSPGWTESGVWIPGIEFASNTGIAEIKEIKKAAPQRATFPLFGAQALWKNPESYVAR